MSQKQLAVEATDESGRRLRAVSQENDFPIPPVEDLERLHVFRPDLVDKAIELAAEEGRERRNRLLIIDRNVFIQNLVANIGAIFVSLTAFIGAIFLALNGHDMAAIGLVGCTLGTVVYAISRAGRA